MCFAAAAQSDEGRARNSRRNSGAFDRTGTRVPSGSGADQVDSRPNRRRRHDELRGSLVRQGPELHGSDRWERGVVIRVSRGVTECACAVGLAAMSALLVTEPHAKGAADLCPTKIMTKQTVDQSAEGWEWYMGPTKYAEQRPDLRGAPAGSVRS